MSSFFSTLKRGQIYLQTWPLEAKLGIIFPENRIIKATKFAQKFMPFMAVFSVVWQQLYAKTDLTALAIAILTALYSGISNLSIRHFVISKVLFLQLRQ